MSDFTKALKLYTWLRKYPADLEEIREEFHLTKHELAIVEEFYERRLKTFSTSSGLFIEAQEDTKSFLIEKMNSLDVLNASLMAQHYEISDLEADPFAEDSSIEVIDKRSVVLSQNQRSNQAYKCLWMKAVVKRYYVELVINGENGLETKNVKPVGLYYLDGTDRVKIIYMMEKEDTIQELDMENIRSCKILEKRRFKQICFSLEDYLNQRCDKEIILRIYHGAKVNVKLKDIFGNRFQIIETLEIYDRVSVKVNDPMEYCKLLESFGMSVIVESPGELRNRILERAKESLTYYQMEGKKNNGN